jgi:hypothetical protein
MVMNLGSENETARRDRQSVMSRCCIVLSSLSLASMADWSYTCIRCFVSFTSLFPVLYDNRTKTSIETDTAQNDIPSLLALVRVEAECLSTKTRHPPASNKRANIHPQNPNVDPCYMSNEAIVQRTSSAYCPRVYLLPRCGAMSVVVIKQTGYLQPSTTIIGYQLRRARGICPVQNSRLKIEMAL